MNDTALQKLCAEMVIRAALDSRKGDREAQRWLEKYGDLYCAGAGFSIGGAEIERWAERGFSPAEGWSETRGAKKRKTAECC